MKIAAAVFAAAGVLAAGAVQADAGEDLLKKSGCTACHSIDKKLVGPPYVEVAAKYKGDAGAAAKLAEKVKKGGLGRLGPGADAAEPAGERRRHQDDDRLHPRAEEVAARAASRGPSAKRWGSERSRVAAGGRPLGASIHGGGARPRVSPGPVF